MLNKYENMVTKYKIGKKHHTLKTLGMHEALQNKVLTDVQEGELNFFSEQHPHIIHLQRRMGIFFKGYEIIEKSEIPIETIYKDSWYKIAGQTFIISSEKFKDRYQLFFEKRGEKLTGKFLEYFCSKIKTLEDFENKAKDITADEVFKTKAKDSRNN